MVARGHLAPVQSAALRTCLCCPGTISWGFPLTWQNKKVLTMAALQENGLNPSMDGTSGSTCQIIKSHCFSAWSEVVLTQKLLLPGGLPVRPMQLTPCWGFLEMLTVFIISAMLGFRRNHTQTKVPANWRQQHCHSPDLAQTKLCSLGCTRSRHPTPIWAPWGAATKAFCVSVLLQQHSATGQQHSALLPHHITLCNGVTQTHQQFKKEPKENLRWEHYQTIWEQVLGSLVGLQGLGLLNFFGNAKNLYLQNNSK